MLGKQQDQTRHAPMAVPMEVILHQYITYSIYTQYHAKQCTGDLTLTYTEPFCNKCRVGMADLPHQSTVRSSYVIIGHARKRTHTCSSRVFLKRCH